MFLEIKNLIVDGSDGKEILKSVDLFVNKGEVCALLGPNASGKSTLAKAIAGNPKYKIKQGKISEEAINYLRMRGLTEKQAISLVINGFLVKE